MKQRRRRNEDFVLGAAFQPQLPDSFNVEAGLSDQSPHERFDRHAVLWNLPLPALNHARFEVWLDTVYAARVQIDPGANDR